MAKRGKLSKPKGRSEDERPVRWRRYPHLFLIVCEDGKTEPFYFDQFKAKIPPDTIFLRTVGTGRSSLGVVVQAIGERNSLAEDARKLVDETWAVFDKDDADLVPSNKVRFDQAFDLAQKEQISVAFSNEVFELWLLLHFMEVSPGKALGRREIYLLLEAAIRAKSGLANYVYKHGNTEVVTLVEQWGDPLQALARAKKLLAYFKGTDPILSNPCTSIPFLVERLSALIDWYSFDLKLR